MDIIRIFNIIINVKNVLLTVLNVKIKMNVHSV